MAPSPSPSDGDLENPYAPPDPALAPEARREWFSNVPFNVGDLLGRAWFLYKTFFRAVMRFTLSSFSLKFAVILLSSMLHQSVVMTFRDELLGNVVWIGGMFGSLVAEYFIGIGLTIALLKLERGQLPTIEELLGGAHQVLAVLLSTILFWLALAAPLGVGYLAMWGLFANLEGLMMIIAIPAAVPICAICVAVSICMATRLGQYIFLVIDWNAGVLESLKLSWQLTRHRSATIFLVYAIWITIYFAVFVFALFGLLAGMSQEMQFILMIAVLMVVSPLANLLLIVTYRALTADVPESTDEPPRVAG
jgi:hypothetical protein